MQHRIFFFIFRLIKLQNLTILSLTLLLEIAALPTFAEPPATVFTVSGSRLLKNGSEFVIHGVNVNGPGWKWDRKTVLDVDAIVKLWKFNLVRVNCSIKPSPATDAAKNEIKTDPQVKPQTGNNLDEIIQAFTSRSVVVLIDPHDHAGGYYQDPAQPGNTPSLTDLVTWQKALAARYKDNPYVWFEVMDGPGKREEKMAEGSWREVHERVIKAIRQEGMAGNIIVCEGRNEGYEETRNSTLPLPDSLSALLTYGPELSQRYPNLLYAVHIDGNWNGGMEKITDYIDRVQAKHLALFISEYGTQGYPDSTPAIDAMLTVCKPRHIGRCVWHWFPGDGLRLCAPDDKQSGWQIDTLDGSKPSNLSWLGDKVWDDNHGLVPLHGPMLDRTAWTATAFAASTENNSHNNQPDEAFNTFGMQDDYWTSRKPQEPGQWFQVDMGAPHTFSRLQIDTRARFSDYMRGYELYVSNDGMTWSGPIVKGKNEQSVLRLSFPAQTARYIKLVQTGKTWHDWVIANLEVYAPVGTSLQASALKLPAHEMLLDSHLWRASSNPKIYNVQMPLMTVQNKGEYASSGQAQQPGLYYQVDMQEAQRLYKIVWDTGYNGFDYLRGYEVYVSNDGMDWGRPIAAGRGAPITTIVFPTQTARYIRIVTTRHSRNHWALTQLRAYSGETGAVGPAAHH